MAKDERADAGSGTPLPGDALSRPLGLGPAPGDRRDGYRLAAIVGALPTRRMAAVLALLLALPPAVWLVAGDGNPQGGEVIARIATAPPPPLVAAAPAAPAPAAKPLVPEPLAGVRTGRPGGPKILHLPDDDGGGEALGADAVVISDPGALAAERAATDPALIERAAEGPLPQIAADGRRPLDVYARPAPPTRGPRIALIVTGLGLNAEATEDAVTRLPPTVTMAFAPYGGALDARVRRARSLGHEILLQLPMEPFGYPATDPGPRTLTVAAGPDGNLRSLRWLMSRFTGYVGVVNYMGGRLGAETEALRPLIAEIGRRGLLYLDDRSAPTSRAREAAGTAAPFLAADLVLDADPSGAAIDARLAELEERARAGGRAIGTAVGLPATLDRLAAWIPAATRRGIVFVPVSALALAGEATGSVRR